MKKKYLVKFPNPIREKNKNLSYINNAFSEYIGSSIFKLIGINAQNVILGTYNYKGTEKVVCACEDFTNENEKLYEFETLALSTNPDKKIGTELSDIIEVLEESSKIDKENVIKSFFNMFIVDAFIGNEDRRNGNWGFLLNGKKDSISFAPVYDCGSCLNSLLEDEILATLKDSEIKNLALNTYSCLKENGKRINSFSFLKTTENKDVIEALLRIFPKIKKENIIKLINEITCITEVRKNFYKTILTKRYEILKEIYQTYM